MTMALKTQHFALFTKIFSLIILINNARAGPLSIVPLFLFENKSQNALNINIREHIECYVNKYGHNINMERNNNNYYYSVYRG